MALPRRKRRTKRSLRWKNPIVIARVEFGPQLWEPLTFANITKWQRRREGWDRVFTGQLFAIIVPAPWRRRRSSFRVTWS